MTDKHRKIIRITLFVYVAVVIALSTYPVPERIETGNDKVNHLAAFALFVILASVGYNKTPWWHIATAGLVLGVFIELIQMPIPSRSAEFLDVAADAAGIISGHIIIHIFRYAGSKTRVV